MLRRHAATDRAGAVAIVDGRQRVRYGELFERSLGYARVLREAGLAPGDRVAIFLPRSVEAVVALFATFLAGGVAVVVHEALRRLQVNHILEHSEAALLVTSSRQRLYLVDPAMAKERILDIDGPGPAAGEGPPPAAIGADLALTIYTSGSTGLPKGVMVCHANLLAGAGSVSDYLNLSERDVLLSLLPFSFDYGLNQLLTALLVGGTLVIQRSLFPADICRTLRREEVTGLAGVPTLWLLDGPSPFTRESFPHLRYVTNTGGRLPERAVRLIRRAHPHVQVYLMYGLTEAFRSTYLPPAEGRR